MERLEETKKLCIESGLKDSDVSIIVILYLQYFEHVDYMYLSIYLLLN